MSEENEWVCPQCDGGFPDNHPTEFLLGDLPFCSEECADEWLADRTDPQDMPE